ncbi:carbohydrate sulfotransferase 12-like [Branchiostoma floridae x Branchiostoma belcheri]
MVSVRSTFIFLFLFILILSTGAYMFISYNIADLSLKKMVSGASASYRERAADTYLLTETASSPSPSSVDTKERETWENLTEAETEQSRRITMLNTYCARNFPKGASKPSRNNHIFIFDKIKTVYCYIPKTGCTTMKLLLYNLEHNETEKLSWGFRKVDWLPSDDKSNRTSGERDVEWIHRQKFKSLEDYSEEEVSLRLATYKKIIVVRDPLERLASAWFDKFVITPERVGEYAFVNRMRRGLDSLEDRTLIDELSKINEERTDNDPKRVSFREFLFAVSHRKVESQHWLSFDRLCTPCKIDYDFVAHTDTIASDIRLFLKQNNITANEDVLPKHQSRNVNNGNVFKDFYGRVPIDEILPLQKVFQKDFDMFGYSFEEDLAKRNENHLVGS